MSRALASDNTPLPSEGALHPRQGSSHNAHPDGINDAASGSSHTLRSMKSSICGKSVADSTGRPRTEPYAAPGKGGGKPHGQK